MVPVRVGTQGLIRSCLKTFVALFLPARLIAPRSPRMSWTKKAEKLKPSSRLLPRNQRWENNQLWPLRVFILTFLFILWSLILFTIEGAEIYRPQEQNLAQYSMTSPPFNISCIFLFHIWNSLRSRRLEVVDERENGRARGRHALFVRGQSVSVKICDRLRNGCHVIRLGGETIFGDLPGRRSPSPRVCPSRARVFSCVPTTSKRLLRRLYLEKKNDTNGWNKIFIAYFYNSNSLA